MVESAHGARAYVTAFTVRIRLHVGDGGAADPVHQGLASRPSCRALHRHSEGVAVGGAWWVDAELHRQAATPREATTPSSTRWSPSGRSQLLFDACWRFLPAA